MLPLTPFPLEITNQFNLNLNEKIIDVELGGFHTFILTNQNRIFAFGSNQAGQLGIGTVGAGITVPEEIDLASFLEEDEYYIIGE